MREAVVRLNSMKRCVLLATIVGLSVTVAYAQESTTPSKKFNSMTLSEGKIDSSAKNSKLRDYLNLLVSQSGRVYFNYKSTAITSQAKAMLGILAEYMNQHPKLTVVLEGRSAGYGEEKGNCSLAAERAEEVKQYLAAEGISTSRMWAYGSCGQAEEKSKQNDPEEELSRVDFFLN